MIICKYQRIYMAFLMLCLVFIISTTVVAQQNINHRYRTQIHPQRASVDIKDKIIELQCYAKCGHTTEQLLLCHNQCIYEVMRGPRRGQCPNPINSQIFKNISPQQKLSCLDNCKYDYDCPEVQKCCSSSCGPICMDPIGILDDPVLPPIPKILKYKLPRSHKVELTIESSANSEHYWHVEVRYHIGSLFAARKLSNWHWQPVMKIAEIANTKSKRTDIYFNLRPGRWYQVRVAAINGYGFRGYSEPSKAFTLKHSPKPPKAPQDLKVVSKKHAGRYVNAKIVWCPSKSNLPIEKYKIMWSLYVHMKDESLITNEVYVRDSHQFEITNLLPDSSYYIQVQGMSISGSRRLKSDKKSILFNSTVAPLEQYEPLKCATHKFRHPNNNNNMNNNKRNPNIDIMDKLNSSSNNNTSNNSTKIKLTDSRYDVRFRMNRKYGMVAHISGLGEDNDKIYELCKQETNCDMRGFSAIRARKNSLEFNKLKYDTNYVLKPMHTNSVLFDPAEVFIFSTPKCENFRKRFPEMQVKC